MRGRLDARDSEAIYDPAESQRKGRIVTINFGVNYLAVIVAAIAAVVIGILYYGVLGVGDRQSRMLGASPTRPGPVQGATGLIVGLVNAWVIAVLAPAQRSKRRRWPSSGGRGEFGASRRSTT